MESLSDHKYIDFIIDISITPRKEVFRKPWRTNWAKYKKLVNDKLNRRTLTFDNLDAIESSVGITENTLRNDGRTLN